MDEPNRTFSDNRPSRTRTMAVGLAFLFSASVLVADSETFHWQGAAAASLKINILKGDIVVQSSSSDQIKIRAVKRGRQSDIQQVSFEVEEGSSEVRIRGVYPKRQNRDEPHPKVEIDVTVFLPIGVSFWGETEVGNIEVLHLEDPVRATTIVGDIRIETTSYAEAKTTNGDIKVSMGRMDSNDALDFRTTNGDIEIKIPRSSNVEISADTTNGGFTTDLFPVDGHRYSIPGARVRGKLGAGGQEIRLHTVNGDLKLSSLGG